MSAHIKPIKCWGSGGPNPPKVLMILEELGLDHEVVPTKMSEVKDPDYLQINPNGRIPAIHDPNTGLTLWESGAIVEYLIERYDTEHRLSFAAGTNESYLAKQWLFFQVSGQGPYYGQVAWFKNYHSEKVPSAVERYVKEVNRVTSVLEGHLAKQKAAAGGGDGPWLVGNKICYADLAFFMYQFILPMIATKEEYDVENYPHVKDWINRMMGREAVAKVVKSLPVPGQH